MSVLQICHYNGRRDPIKFAIQCALRSLFGSGGQGALAGIAPRCYHIMKRFKTANQGHCEPFLAKNLFDQSTILS
jgi:hypothetical protein